MEKAKQTRRIQEEHEDEEGKVSRATETRRVVWNKARTLAYGIYWVLYKMGEFLDDLFGISNPRYGYIIREYEREQARLREEKQEADEAGAIDAENPFEQPPPNSVEGKHLYDVENASEVERGPYAV